MELNEIIKEETDRLFIIDRECYIIFTGISLDDEKPFIRIGNFIDLPVEIIPLIENIVITDMIVGNPAYEQFNIDIKYLLTNRYIGSRHIVMKYLNFQKIFDLDLKNITIVDVEKDIPALSKEKLISSRDSFIGIFYTNGNFRILHKDKTIFDLKNITIVDVEKDIPALSKEKLISSRDSFIGIFYTNGNFRILHKDKTIFDLDDIEKISKYDIKIHDNITEVNRETKRYNGEGIIILDNNPLFYKKGYFTSYQFPKNYYNAFLRLSIDTQKIREILQPSLNFINMTRFLKWKNSRNGQMKIFSDYKEEVNLIQELFSSSTIIRKNFNGLNYDTGEGLTIKNYTGTHNIKATYKKTESLKRDISIAYIKNHMGIESIIKENLDGIFINYSVYEDTNLIFKSITAPLAVIDDGNENISRLRGEKPIILYPGIQYELKTYNEIDELFQDISTLLPIEDIKPLLENESDDIMSIIAQYPRSDIIKNKKKRVELFNIITVLRLILDVTTNRRFATTVKKLLLELNGIIDRKNVLTDNESSFNIILVFLSDSIYEYIHPIEEITDIKDIVFDEVDEKDIEKFSRIHDPEIRDLHLKIINDRRRLNSLLELLRSPKEEGSNLKYLEEAIVKRKAKFHYEDIEDEIDLPKISINREYRKKRFKRITAIILSLISATILLFFSIRFGQDYYREYGMKEKLLLEKKKREGLIKRYNIHVSDKDIFTYANQVAKRNGYRRIAITRLKGKNPNWIYPGNNFTMLDGEIVTVVKGDTLWGLSYRKIMRLNLKFYETVDRIKEGRKPGRDTEKDIEVLKKLAFTEKHYKMISSIEKRE